MDRDEVMEALTGAMGGVIDEERYDLSYGEAEDSGGFELATDEWTLVLEAWPVGIGFLALDDEPENDDPDELEASVGELIGDFLAPLRAANTEADGAIATSLARTTDPLSNALSRLLGA